MTTVDPHYQRKNPIEGEKIVTGLVVGRDKKVIPPEEVFKLSALGCRDEEIADWFGIKRDTLKRNFTAELIKGKEAVKQTLRRAMLANAIENNNAAVQIFLAKNLLGMSDNGMTSDANEPLPWIEGDVQEFETEEVLEDTNEVNGSPETDSQ
jgi:hypothetical protein